MTRICAVHNKSQERPIALQHFFLLPVPEIEQSLELSIHINVIYR